jgi:HTH-type transcriptional regulator / antitoxin HipB
MEKNKFMQNGDGKFSEDGKGKDHKGETYTVEVPLQKDIIGRLIKALRKIRNYSQSKLGLLLGVQKAQISKLEKSDRNITLSSMLKIFKALRTKISFKIEVEKKKDLAIIQEVLQEEVSDKKVSNL